MKNFFKSLYLFGVVALFFYGGYLKGQETLAAKAEVRSEEIVKAEARPKDTKSQESKLITAEDSRKKEATLQNPKRIPVDQWQSVDSDLQIPILMYHDLQSGNEYQLPPEEFEHQMQILKERGYYFLTPKEAYICLTQRKRPQEKVVWVTFDDGYKSNYTAGLPIFQKLGLTVTINMVSGGGKLMMTMDQLKKIDNAKGCDVTIESHTVHHHDLDQMTYDEQETEMVESKNKLEHVLGKDMDVIAYPEGKHNVNSIVAARDAGYKMALSTLPGLASIDQGLYELHRIEIKPGFTDEQFNSLIGD